MTRRTQTWTPRYRNVGYAPVRERFAVRHEIWPDTNPEEVISRLRRIARPRRPWPDPSLLTIATAAIVQEWGGWTAKQWQWLMAEESSPPTGPPPPPREAGGVRGRGVIGLWVIELDIVPWLLATPSGVERLRRVVVEIAAGGVRQVGANTPNRFPQRMEYDQNVKRNPKESDK